MIKRSASISMQYDSVFSPFLSNEWEEGLRWAKDCAFDGVELILNDPTLIDKYALHYILEELDLEVSTLSTGQCTIFEGLSMTSAVSYIRSATNLRIQQNIDFSVEFGRPNVTIGLIRGKGGILPESKEYELLKCELMKVADYAAKKNVKLNLEPINRYECVLINSSKSAYDLIMDIGNPPNVGILYDTFHSNIEDKHMLKTIEEIGKKITHVHFADSNRRLPGEGHLDFPLIIQTLKKVGYNGYVSLEVLNIPSAQHIINGAHVSMSMYNAYT